MSCVVGLVDDGRVWLGGDSAASDLSGLVVTYKEPKVFRRGALLFGCVDSFRMRDLLQHSLVVPRYKAGNIDAYIFSVVQAIKDTFSENEYEYGDDVEVSEESGSTGAILVGFHGRLFTVEWDYHIGEVHQPFTAIGEGAKFALGSLLVTKDLTDRFGPRARVASALSVAEHYCNTVRGPFRVISGK